MKNKNILIAGLAVVILVIVALIIVLATKGNDKDKNKDKKDKKETVEKYDVKDQVYDDITISNITVEPLKDQTIVNFKVENNRDEAIPEGMKVFVIESGNVPSEEVSIYLSTIEPNEAADVEVIINGVYNKIDKISVKE